MRDRFAGLLPCVLLSGLAALIYQIAWVEQLSLVFGSAATAVVTVLAAFMTGMAVGALLGGVAAPRLTKPLRAYAAIELGIALTALLVAPALRLAGDLQASLLAGSEGSSSQATVLSFVCSFLVLALPTLLIGATLPIVVEATVRSDRQVGRRVGVLNAVSSAGAAGGALLTAFVLLPELGLDTTLHVAVVSNLLVSATVAILARGWSRPPGAAASGRRARRFHWTLPLVLVSGAVAFTFEVLWTRLFAHLLGGSLYALAAVLAPILIGLAIGSAVAGRLATGTERCRVGFGIAQLGVAFCGFVAFALSDRLPDLVAAPPAATVAGFSSASLLIAALILPGSIFLGSTLPFAVRIVARGAAEASAATALILAWGTVGAVAGCFLAGLVLLPALGFAGTIAATTATSIAVAVVISIAEAPRRPLLGAVLVAGLVAVLLLPRRDPWRLLQYRPLSAATAVGEIVSFGVGRHSTVLLSEQPGGWQLSADGRLEARIRPPGALRRQLAARWLALLPLAARPQSRSLLVIGLGGGTTIEALPAGLASIDVVELEPEMVHANEAIATRRGENPLADPRLRLHLDDARRFLRLTDRRYDAIISQPSHPWSSGSSHLFTREFFTLVDSRLGQDGVFAQWIGVRFVDERSLRSVLATLRSVFGHVQVYQPAPGSAVLLLASQSPMEIAASGDRALEPAASAWAELGVSAFEDLLIAQRLDTAGVDRLAVGATLTTDHHNLLQMSSPRVLQEPLSPQAARDLFAPFDPLPGVQEADEAYLVRSLLRQGERARARIVAQGISDQALRRAANGMIRLAAGQRRLAARALEDALSLDGECVEAVHSLALLYKGPLTAGRVPVELHPYVDEEPLASMVNAWRAAFASEWAVVESLDARLAQIGARDSLFAEATRLRVLWRLRSEDPNLAADALQLLDPLVATAPRQGLMLLRAECAAAAADAPAMVQSLLAVLSAADRSMGSDVVARAREIIDSVEGASETIGYQRLESLLGLDGPPAEPARP